MDKFGPILHIRQERFIASGMFFPFSDKFKQVETNLDMIKKVWTNNLKI